MLAAYIVLAATVSYAGAYTVYGNGATSERTLPLCSSPRESCNVVRRRYWFSPLVHRQCKCPDLSDCPSDTHHRKNTVAFNARAQLKFCSQVGDLIPCRGRPQVAAEIRSNGSISISCYCGPGHSFQKLYSNAAGHYFSCQPYTACRSGDFCGHITANSYETYPVCTCPPGHMCVLQDRRLDYASEFLFQGQAYRGTCQYPSR